MSIPINKESLHTIGIYLLEGMTEREACTLAEVSYNELQQAKEANDIIRDFIEKKHTEFKHNHLKEIQKNKSEKNSQWLLEKLRPEEFGSRPRSQEAPTINIISAIIKDIQNDDQRIVKFTRGNNKAIESNKDGEDRIRVAEVLN